MHPSRRLQVATAAGTAVSTIMTRDVVVVRSKASLEWAVELLLARGLSRLPVVDEAFRPIGMLSKTDVVEDAHDRGGDGEQAERPQRFDKYVEPRGLHEVAAGPTVDEVMTRTLITVDEHASIARAAELMVARHVHGLPVVSRRGELVGIVSALDVLGWLAGLR